MGAHFSTDRAQALNQEVQTSLFRLAEKELLADQAFR
jgi:hypothetical protein